MNTVNHPDIQLAGRRVLVTGGARGLGEAFARALLAAGARVVISDVLHERGAALAAELGSDLHYLPMDLSDPAAISAGVDAAAHCLGGLDGLVNNGAITNSGGKDMADLSVATWDQVMAVNVRGTWLATVAAQPRRPARHRSAPSAAKRRATALPIPPAAPVIIATRPCNRIGPFPPCCDSGLAWVPQPEETPP